MSWRLNNWQDQVCYLDQALTGKDWRMVCQMYRNQPEMHDPINWVGRVYYLSDGGYSRIACDWHGRLFVMSESLPLVKAAWPQCRRLIAEVERAIVEAMNVEPEVIGTAANLEEIEAKVGYISRKNGNGEGV